MHSELLFYGGLVSAGISLLLGIGALVLFKVRAARLGQTLDREYGPRKKPQEDSRPK